MVRLQTFDSTWRPLLSELAPPARSAPPGAAAWKGAESHRHPKFGRRRGRSTSCHLGLWIWGLGFNKQNTGTGQSATTQEPKAPTLNPSTITLNPKA